MEAKTVLLTLALAATILVPAAAAQDSGVVEGLSIGGLAPMQGLVQGPARNEAGSLPLVSTDPALAPPIDLQAPVNLQAPLPDATTLVDDVADVSLSVQVQDASLSVQVQDASIGVSTSGVSAVDPSSVDPPSFGERAAAVAIPAAGASVGVVSLGALAFGLDGLRSFQSRLAGGAVRILRALGALAGAIPLFSRIERGGVLDNPIRARVHDAIAQEPGLSLSEVSQRAGIAWGTTVHHLRRLEAHGLVVSVHELAHKRFFIANTPAASQRAALAVVMHPTARRIAEYVAVRPGTDQAGLCRALGLNNPAASKHLGHFESRGLVLSERSGRSRLYHPTGGLHSVLQLLEPAGSTAVRTARTAPAVTVVATPRPMLTVGAT